MMSREMSAQSGGWDSEEENKGDEYVYDPNVDSSAKRVLYSLILLGNFQSLHSRKYWESIIGESSRSIRVSWSKFRLSHSIVSPL